MTSTYAKVGSLAAALLLVVGAATACSTSTDSGGAPSAESSGAASAAPAAGGGKMDGAPKQEAPVTSAPGADTVVFEVTGTGSAMTIDLVPSGDQRLYDVPLPWSSTVTIAPDVAQLQVVVVGTGVNSPGCRITLNGELVAEKPEGGDAHCVFDR